MSHASGRTVFTRKYFLRVAVINLVAATAAVLLLAWFGKIVAAIDLWRAIVEGLIYAYVMGTIGATLLPLVALRFEGRPFWVRMTAIGAGIVVMTVVGCAVGGAVVVLIGFATAKQIVDGYFTILRFSLIIALTAGSAMYLFETMRSRLQETTLALRERQLAEERAMKLAAEARLSSLESRIHPHFLFNTLNSIAALIQDDPKRAEEIVGRLSALLRFSLDANQRRLVPLEQELQIVRDYLEIEKARFGDRLRYSIDLAPEVQEASLPPLAIESLVENSVKHAIAPRREGGEIAVSARAADGCVSIEVADSGPGFDLAAVPPGHGLDNLLARLQALYGGAARLETARDGERAVVRVTLPEAS
ncbi:MAG: sensor histidine kinase [Bryobacteraceae bacterium]